MNIKHLVFFTTCLLLGSLSASAIADNIATIQIKFERVQIKGNNGPDMICPVSTTPRNANDNENGYCKNSANYESDLACLDKIGADSTITFKPTGPDVDYTILGEDQRLPSFMDCEPGNGRTVICTLTKGGNYKYSIVTTGQSEDCMLDPRVIINDRGPTPRDENE